jgi:glutamate-ammonia-ligase adenylyltransferase
LTEFDQKIESLARDLPDAEGSRLFIERLATEHPRAVKTLLRDPGLLSDALALAAWSPLLATTLAQHADYLSWLARERGQTRVRTREEFGEALARFALTNSQLDAHALLARFRRRELLRIYLHDIRRSSTLIETTEQLSNLADAALEYALSLARQDLENKHGAPQCTDARGRTRAASFCIVALGKLGSHELNYASDIDLLFLYSDDGVTTGKGTRGETTNREYFIKLAERIARIVGQPAGEGAAYRVDLRLRPYGRDGALASSLSEAVRYYRETAHAWELQALIRSRAAAGSAALYARFHERVLHRIYGQEETVAHALAQVQLAKQKIDRQHTRDSGGFNVKLGRGGIREIEFIAQALQLAHGGRDQWLRAAHTLISLGRLADRHLITERERTELSDAYLFLRMLEHRLQMEHGLQTHSVTDEPTRRALVARRMSFKGEAATDEFDRALRQHTTNVRAAYERVFGEPDEGSSEVMEASAETRANDDEAAAMKSANAATKDADALTKDTPGFVSEREQTVEQPDTLSLAVIFAAHNAAAGAEETEAVKALEQSLRAAAKASLNPRRALQLTARIASSLDKSTIREELTDEKLCALVRLCGASEFFGEMLANNPLLIRALPGGSAGAASERDYGASLRSAVEGEESFRAELATLRRAWAALLIEIGAQDAAGRIAMREANARQTELAAASLDAACLIARREMERRYMKLAAEPRVAVLGLGRLGGGGMDYGSDLDVVLVYDETQPAPIPTLDHAEAYARFGELLVAALSSLTRDGSLYRVDLRLRPDGRNGPTCVGARAFTRYLQERAAPWEWLAYVKLRAAAGALALGSQVESEARSIIHQAARSADAELLRAETRRVRERLEHERARERRRGAVEIKFGAGGMLDVYFATRYLQLRDDVQDEGASRSTPVTLERLRVAGSLSEQDYAAMHDGYALLRSLDHCLRLVIGRSARLPAAEHPALRDIAARLDYPSSAALITDLNERMASVRAAYDRITKA